MKKVCQICQSEFETKYWHKKYCSKECAYEAQKRQFKRIYLKKKMKAPCYGLSDYDIPIDLCLNCNLDKCKHETK